jgi:hypothetical protein
MRRLLLICLLAGALMAGLLVPVAGGVSTGDGTLALRNGDGDPATPVVNLDITGVVVAQVDKGRIAATSVDGVDPVVTGDVTKSLDTDHDGFANYYVGKNLKLRTSDGHFKVRIFGTGVALNAVGQGTARVAGIDGWYSYNGSDRLPLPLLPKLVTISA